MKKEIPITTATYKFTKEITTLNTENNAPILVPETQIEENKRLNIRPTILDHPFNRQIPLATKKKSPESPAKIIVKIIPMAPVMKPKTPEEEKTTRRATRDKRRKIPELK